jgi:hypothetical protein
MLLKHSDKPLSGRFCVNLMKESPHLLKEFLCHHPTTSYEIVGCNRGSLLKEKIKTFYHLGHFTSIGRLYVRGSFPHQVSGFNRDRVRANT